jgi:hypothetical protein
MPNPILGRMAQIQQIQLLRMEELGDPCHNTLIKLSTPDAYLNYEKLRQ